jgi:hypothetical protein
MRDDILTHKGWISMTRIVWKGSLSLALICGLVLTYGLVTKSAEADSVVKSVPTGSWGGEHIRLDVTETGAKVEFDCAVGTIDEPLLLDKAGNFEARGTHAFARGGPGRPGMPALHRQRPALYRGWTDAREMRLTVTLLDTGHDVGTFSLGQGRRANLERCL